MSEKIPTLDQWLESGAWACSKGGCLHAEQGARAEFELKQAAVSLLGPARSPVCRALGWLRAGPMSAGIEGIPGGSGCASGACPR
jgi:hypothetical protein